MATARSQALRARAKNMRFCAVGTAKTNLGHLDIAAGVTGLIHQRLSFAVASSDGPLSCPEIRTSTSRVARFPSRPGPRLPSGSLRQVLHSVLLASNRDNGRRDPSLAIRPSV